MVPLCILEVCQGLNLEVCHSGGMPGSDGCACTVCVRLGHLLMRLEHKHPPRHPHPGSSQSRTPVQGHGSSQGWPVLKSTGSTDSDLCSREGRAMAYLICSEGLHRQASAAARGSALSTRRSQAALPPLQPSTYPAGDWSPAPTLLSRPESREVLECRVLSPYWA